MGLRSDGPRKTRGRRPQGDFLRGVVDVIALVIVGALVSGNDRVAVIHALNDPASVDPTNCCFSAHPSSTASITSTLSITFPSAATARGTPTFRGAATASRTETEM